MPLSVQYRTASMNHFDLTIVSDLRDEEIQSILVKVHHLPKCKRPFRKRGYIDFQSNAKSSIGYLKYNKILRNTFPPGLWLKSIRRLNRGELVNEGKAYLRCSELKLPIPKLLFFGDKKKIGIRCEEVIFSAKVFGKSIMELYQNIFDEYWLYSAMDCLIKFHKAKIAHGDCMLHNFINDGKITIAMDLENSTTLDRETQFNDLRGFVYSTLILSNNIIHAKNILDYYEEKSKIDLPVKNKKILKASEKLYKNKLRVRKNQAHN